MSYQNELKSEECVIVENGVPRQMSRLDDSLNSLLEEIAILEEKLGPIIAASPEETKAKLDVPEEASPLATELRGIERRTMLAKERLYELRIRVDL